MSLSSLFGLHCANSLDILSKIPDGSIDMIFCDPPFNVGIKYNTYVDKIPDYKKWCETWIDEGFRVLKTTGTFYLMTLDRHLYFKMAAMEKHGVFVNLVKWRNASAVHDKRRFVSSTQPILIYAKTQSYTFNTYAQRQRNKFQRWGEGDADKGQLSDYWEDIPFIYAGSIKHPEAILKENSNAKAHPCQMPIGLAARCVLFSTNENEVVLDLFSGSCTMPVACELLKRKWIGCEIDQQYYELGQKRIELSRQNLFAQSCEEITGEEAKP